MPSRRYKANAELLEHMREAHATSRRLYGSPRITAELNEQGLRCGKNLVSRLMKEGGIWAKVKRRRFRRTTDSRHDYALAANLLIDRHQSQQVWIADMTFVSTSEGWLYVSAVMDMKSRARYRPLHGEINLTGVSQYRHQGCFSEAEALQWVNPPF